MLQRILPRGRLRDENTDKRREDPGVEFYLSRLHDMIGARRRSVTKPTVPQTTPTDAAEAQRIFDSMRKRWKKPTRGLYRYSTKAETMEPGFRRAGGRS